ncbi:hypothetical protein HanPSC8_Chr05g0214371 [Helianthus annuus]|nr:hypothetical protein HanPSC8_Chr05g0214371 [Helianthus annuus]
MCLDPPLYTALYTLDSVASLSQYMGIDGIGTSHRRMSVSRSLIHSASLPAAASAMSSASIVEWAIHVCFLLAQETAPPARVKIHPLVDFESFVRSIQLASE